ncbi:GFA family protein [Wenzhouxiangella sp. AB-CW3]|uniref:GFA family protein n=1 Tax=Wenzhouxiangella sp. AB-CW3 TaxID=2771012 RepID=UPI00168B73F8|nr:GFA family protein [Wenzhouxiangella sp. AB-CW3]QOC21611.1 GFA family protein [Wenzhouxiangella sp. AB-CW3]
MTNSESRTHAELTGQCLCGSVRVAATPENLHFGACHCAMCRKWGGGPMLAIHCKDQVHFEGEHHIGTFASSEWAERGFCTQCGTHLFYRLKEDAFYALPLGLFDDSSDWTFAEQIFIDQKPPYYSFADKTRNLTEAEVFALYTEPGTD